MSKQLPGCLREPREGIRAQVLQTPLEQGPAVGDQWQARRRVRPWDVWEARAAQRVGQDCSGEVQADWKDASYDQSGAAVAFDYCKGAAAEVGVPSQQTVHHPLVCSVEGEVPVPQRPLRQGTETLELPLATPDPALMLS